MTAEPVVATSTKAANPPPPDAAEPRERTPWLLAFLCLLIPVLPSFSVLPGPLKSNGSPAKLIAVSFFGLAVLGFVLLRRTASTRTVRPGALIILLYFLLQLTVYAVGLTRTGSALVEGNKTRALMNLVANVGVALYILARVRTARERHILIGCLATGLAFACMVGLLQSLTNIDLRYFFAPPGFVINADELEMGERWGAKRVMGTSQHAIEFSVLAVITVPLTVYLARNAARRWVQWTAALACALALLSMPAAVSRSGVIALAAVLLVYMWNFTLRQLATGIVVGGFAFGGYLVAFPDTANALWNTITNSSDDPSVLSRASDYAMVSNTFREHPVFGLGLGGTPPTEYGYLDNEWLQSIVQGGLIGLTAMMVLTLGGILGFNAALRAASISRERDQGYALGAVFIAITASTLFFDLMNFQQASRILFIAFGLLWCNYTVSLAAAGTTRKERRWGRNFDYERRRNFRQASASRNA